MRSYSSLFVQIRQNFTCYLSITMRRSEQILRRRVVTQVCVSIWFLDEIQAGWRGFLTSTESRVASRSHEISRSALTFLRGLPVLPSRPSFVLSVIISLADLSRSARRAIHSSYLHALIRIDPSVAIHERNPPLVAIVLSKIDPLVRLSV